MKKFFIYFFSFVFICFILPAIFTKGVINFNFTKNNEQKENTVGKQEENEQTESVNLETKTINLLHKKTGEIENVNMGVYLYSVVSAEMPASFEIEALKAQSIVARTYTAYKMQDKKHENADICDDSTCCQAWISKDDRLSKWEESSREENWKKIEQCVNETSSQVITYQGSPIAAFFHSNSGGTTETPVNVWGGSGYPYLQTVATAGEEGYTQYASEIVLTNEQIIEKLKTKYQDIQIDFNNIEEIKILEYTDGNRVKTIKFGNHNLSGVETRTLFGLKSANFEILKENENIKFTVKGYGHGVGMSQTGADTLAKQGKKYDEIIHHYYTDVKIEKM